MIKTDEQDNLYILSDNSGYFTIKELPKVSGKLKVVFCGDSEITKEFDISGQTEVVIKLTKQEVEDIGVGVHRWYADLIYGDETDTILYNTISVIEKEM